MKTLRLIGFTALSFGIAGCAGKPSLPTETGPVASKPAPKSPKLTPKSASNATNALPDRVAAAPENVAAPRSAYAPETFEPETVDLGPYQEKAPAIQEGAPVIAFEPAPVETIAATPYETVDVQPTYTLASVTEPEYIESSAPLGRGQMAPIRDDPLDSGPRPTRASTYNVAALKAAYQPSEALSVSAPPARVRNTPSPEFGQELAQSALARLNPNVAYVAAYKKIGYPWGDVSEATGVCTDVVIRSYRGLGIDLQSMVHEDMQQAFSAYPSKKIYGLNKADPNIDHRRVVNLEAFFERVGAAIPIGSDYQPGDVITWRLSGGEPHIGVVVDERDPKSGNRMIVHNLGAGVRSEDLLDYAPPHGAYRFSPDQQSRMASLALKQG